MIYIISKVLINVSTIYDHALFVDIMQNYLIHISHDSIPINIVCIVKYGVINIIWKMHSTNKFMYFQCNLLHICFFSYMYCSVDLFEKITFKFFSGFCSMTSAFQYRSVEIQINYKNRFSEFYKGQFN